MSVLAPPLGDAEAERAWIDRLVEGKTVCDFFARNAVVHGSRPALFWKEGGSWRHLTWSGYRERVAEASLALMGLGVGRGDFVAIMAANRPEHLVADLGALHAGAVPVSIYTTFSPEQVSYVAAHCAAKVAIVEDLTYLERWVSAKPDLPGLTHVVVIEAPERLPAAEGVTVVSWGDLLAAGREALSVDDGWGRFDASWRQVGPDDPATVIYTSGTTGPPKGVVLTHRNELWTAASAAETGVHPDYLRTVSYLPLAHSLERVATHYLGIYKVAQVYLCPDVLQVFDVAAEVHPQGFAGVPRVWEKLQAGIMAAIDDEPNERRRAIARQAVEVGRRAVRLEQRGEPVPLGLRLQRELFERLVFRKVRTRIGLDQCMVAVSGAAPIAPDVLEFFWGIGLPIHEGWGMTESTAPATINREGQARIGTVGPPLPGVEVRLAEDGEILVRGGNVSPGYFRDPEQTAATFDPDGWLHTGDIGSFDPDGYLRIVDRKKELLITASGKNVSPANLENLLKQHPLVGQACAVGDRRPYVAALVVLDGEALPGWARDHGIPFRSSADIGTRPELQSEIQRAVDEANRHVSQAESIKRFRVLPEEWTVEGGELTPTLKLKRRIVHEKYAEEIEQLYA